MCVSVMHVSCMGGACGVHVSCMGGAWELHGRCMGAAWEVHVVCMGGAWEVHVSWIFSITCAVYKGWWLQLKRSLTGHARGLGSIFQ